MQGWAQGSFVEAERSMAEARQTEFEARPRRGDPLKNPPSPRCIAVPSLVVLSQTVYMTDGKWPCVPPSWVEGICHSSVWCFTGFKLELELRGRTLS